MAGGVEGAGYGERAEFVYDGAKVGVLSAQVKNAPPALEGWRRGGGRLRGTCRIRLRWDGGRRIERAQVKTRRRLWRVGGAEEAGYGERAEFVYDGTEVGVSSARR